MLQNNPVRNLQYDSDLRIAQQTRIDPPVFEDSNIITSVPRRNSLVLSRIPLPISTVQIRNDARTNSNRTFVPISGLEILDDMPSLHIEQTFELNETFTSISSENRYSIRSPFGEALFAGTESSLNNNNNNRIIFGPAIRSFQMHLLDKTHQETLTLRKKFSLGYICCQPRKLEVWVPPGDLLGIVHEEYTICSTQYTIKNQNDEILYYIKGLNRFNFCMPKEAHFQIFSSDMQNLIGSIVRMWSADLSQYTLNIYFNDFSLNVKSKALFLGAAFLLEYIYFQTKF